MEQILKMATVRFTRLGFHNWPDAPPSRAYLAQMHRHIFWVEASVELRHNEREIEFHDFLDFCKEHFGGGPDESMFGAKSCETLGEELLEKIRLRYTNRSLRVRVFEDNEVGAELLYALT